MPTSQTDIDDLLAIERRVMHGIQHKDQKALDHLLASEFVLRMPGSEAVHKTAFLEMVQSIPGIIESIQAQEIVASVIDGLGVVTGVQEATVRLDETGTTATSRTAFTDLFRRNPEGWQLVLATSVELAPASNDG